MTWTSVELDRVGAADELQVSSRRADGSLRPYVTIWVVRVGDDLYVRSASGPGNGWYRRAVTAGAGRIRAGGVERDVRFEAAGPDAAAAIDEAYHAKYDRYPKEYVDPVVGPGAATVTLRLVAR
jgi:hypothetical protein